VSAVGEAGEVVSALVYVLKERGLGIDEARRAQDPMDLLSNDVGLQYVLKHRLYDDAIKGLAHEGNTMPIGDQLDEWAPIDVKGQSINVGRAIKISSTPTDSPTTNYQYYWPLGWLRISAKKFEHTADVPFRPVAPWPDQTAHSAP
jgi:hypothetical protein